MAEPLPESAPYQEAPDQEAPSPSADSVIEQLLVHTEGSLSPGAKTPALAERALPLAPGLHLGSLVSIAARSVIVSAQGREHAASLAEHVDADFLRAAQDGREPVLLEASSEGLSVVGVLQGKFPSRLVGDRVVVTGATEVVVQSGKAALRLRQDGVVDLIGARISASSRGLLRLVGRALRLN